MGGGRVSRLERLGVLSFSVSDAGVEGLGFK